MACPICSRSMAASFASQVLGKYHAEYEACDGCGFLRAKDPFWLEEAYASPVAAQDTGLVFRNFDTAWKIAGLLYWLMGERGEGRYLDAAGGYGIFTRLLRDAGFDFYWADKYCDNLLARGFEYSPDQGPCRAATAIEALEHAPDPVGFLEEVLKVSGADVVIFTTVLYEGAVPPPRTWWYYSFSTGQHISFFQRRTLDVMAARMGFVVSSAHGIHIFSKGGFNRTRLSLVTSRYGALAASLWIPRHLESRTMSDHIHVVSSRDVSEQRRPRDGVTSRHRQ